MASESQLVPSSTVPAGAEVIRLLQESVQKCIEMEERIQRVLAKDAEGGPS